MQGKKFDKIQYSFKVKAFKKLCIEEMYLSIMKAMYDINIALGNEFLDLTQKAKVTKAKANK